MVRDNQRVKNVIGPGGVRYPVTLDAERLLRSMDRGALRSLALETASYSPEAMRRCSCALTPEDEPTASELLAAVDAALGGVDLDYHGPFYETSTTESKRSRRPSTTGAAPSTAAPPSGATCTPAPSNPARRPGTGRPQRRRVARGR